jgi:hypothetical protein
MIYFGYPLDIHGWKTKPETKSDRFFCPNPKTMDDKSSLNPNPQDLKPTYIRPETTSLPSLRKTCTWCYFFLLDLNIPAKRILLLFFNAPNQTTFHPTFLRFTILYFTHASLSYSYVFQFLPLTCLVLPICFQHACNNDIYFSLDLFSVMLHAKRRKVKLLGELTIGSNELVQQCSNTVFF